jgi:hypothetical protein
MTDEPLIIIELTARGNIGFRTIAKHDDIVRARPHEVLEQLELLAARLRACEYPFGFLAQEKGDETREG